MDLKSVRRWIASAVSDGWHFKRTYESESVETAVTFERQGFTVLAVARPAKTPGNPFNSDYVSIHAWGPDGLALLVPEVYSWDKLVSGMTKCRACGASGKTVRVGFAGRVCESCREVYKAEMEPRGWAE